MCIRHGIQDAFGFTADRFFPCLVAPTILTFMYNVVAQGKTPGVENLLHGGAFHFGQQTGVIHLALRDHEEIKGKGKVPTMNISETEYFWQQKNTKPFGQQLPPQCWKCGSVYSWSKAKYLGDSLTFLCTGFRVSKNQAWAPCSNVWTVNPVRDAFNVGGDTGEWKYKLLGSG